jgi:Spy/CpxP family protein refolding chaperone
MMALARSRIWFAVFVLVVFLIGLATGVAINRFSPYGPAAPRGLSGGRPGPRPALLADRMSRQLELNETQKQQLEEIFKRAAQRMEAFRRDSRQQFATLSRELDSEIEAVLTPEQREKFREMRRSRRPGRVLRPR